jgi:hypothetical protein
VQLVPDGAEVLALGQSHEREEAGDDDGRAEELVERDPGRRRRDRVAELDLLQDLEPLRDDRGKDAAAPDDDPAGAQEVVVVTLCEGGRVGSAKAKVG